MNSNSQPRILIVGNRGGTNIGECFERAAISFGLEVCLLESRRAMDAPSWLRRLNWHLRGHRPTKLGVFSEAVYQQCSAWRPDALLTTGLAPLHQRALERIRSLGILTLNYLTDDPWNRTHYASWFMNAVTQYDFVFSPRRANVRDLKAAGCRSVDYLPFAYDPSIHFAERACGPDYSADVLFIGGADRDRLPYCEAIIQAGLRLSLYGDYWDRYAETREYFRGYASVGVLRMATPSAKVCLCLVRRANRDGHVMRSFEAPAMGGCMLVEDTTEHRELFAETVMYFKSIPEMVERAKWLLKNETERKRLAAAAHHRITTGWNTYADRLQTMLERTGLGSAALMLR